MSRKKKMTPAQKAAARRTGTVPAEAAEAPVEPASARPGQAPPPPRQETCS